MSEKKIHITDNDMERLRELIMVAREFGSEQEKYLLELENELDKGEIVKSKDIPKDVITMNSKVCLKNIKTGEKKVYYLVFPKASKADEGKISILAPIGTALLGYKVGDIIDWQVPAGVVKFKVEEILYQPEAAGDYDL